MTHIPTQAKTAPMSPLGLRVDSIGIHLVSICALRTVNDHTFGSRRGGSKRTPSGGRVGRGGTGDPGVHVPNSAIQTIIRLLFQFSPGRQNEFGMGGGGPSHPAEKTKPETHTRSHGRRQLHIIYWPSESSTFARCCTFVNTRRKPSHATCEDRWRDAVTYTCIE